MVCYGSGCNVTFSKVKFDSCSLIVLAGATVTLINCTFFRDPSTAGPNGVHLFAHACDTLVSMCDSTVTGGLVGIACHQAAKIQLCNVTVTDVHGIACEVRQGMRRECVRLLLTDCKLQYTHKQSPSLIDQKHCPCGVLAHEGVTLLGKVDIRGVAVGFMVIDAELSMLNCSVSNVSDRCVVFKDDEMYCVGALTRCIFMGAGGAAVEFEGVGKGTLAMVDDCKLLRNGGWGVLVCSAQVVCINCSSQGNKLGGFMAVGGAIFRLVDFTSKRDTMGVCVGDATCYLTRVVVEESVSDAFTVTSMRAKAEILNCRASDCKGTALVLSGRGHRVLAVEFVAVGSAGGNGAHISSGARADLKQCLFDLPESAVGMTVLGRGTDVSGEGCGFTAATGVLLLIAELCSEAPVAT